MNRPCGDGAELRLARRVRIELVGDEQDHALLEQAVVEGAEELGREQGQRTAAREADG